MDTDRLRQFCTIVETGNLRRAAELLGISHSGLSKSMQALEQETGIKLFLPHGRGIVASDQGRRLYERSGPFFSELARLLGADQAPPELPRVRIGSFEVFTSYFMGKLMREQLRDYEVEVHELVPGRLEDALLLQKVDLGITYEPIPREGIEYVKITSLMMGAFTLNEAFAGEDLLKIPFVVPVSPLEGAPSGVKGRDGWPEERFKRITRYRVDLMTTGLELVHEGLCAIFIPKFVARLHNEGVRSSLKLVSRELPKGLEVIKRDVYIVKRESTPESVVIQKVAKALRKIV